MCGIADMEEKFTVKRACRYSLLYAVNTGSVLRSLEYKKRDEAVSKLKEFCDSPICYSLGVNMIFLISIPLVALYK